ncbi:DUF2946 family protein [Inquilinus sp. CAU 1745]|uniref:DUF2946 family protein n=1 Tax=Inquilinus sp. CAU 1745 TaxID=3140369 RepID=UPI00325BC480
MKHSRACHNRFAGWLALIGLLFQALTPLAQAAPVAGPRDFTVVDPATGIALPLVLCTALGGIENPDDGAPAGRDAAHDHVCVLCSLHAAPAALSPVGPALPQPLVAEAANLRPADAPRPAPAILFGWRPRGPPFLA